MSGHGHVTPNANGFRARCGGPRICKECALEYAQAHPAAQTSANVCAVPMLEAIKALGDRCPRCGRHVIAFVGKMESDPLAIIMHEGEGMIERSDEENVMAARCDECGRFCRYVAVHGAEYRVPHCTTCEGPQACYMRGDPYPLLWKPCPVCGDEVGGYRGYTDDAVHLGHMGVPPYPGAMKMTLFATAHPSPDGFVSCAGGWSLKLEPVEQAAVDAFLDANKAYIQGLPDLRGSFRDSWDARPLRGGSDGPD